MPVNFLSLEQRNNYGCYPHNLSEDLIANHFFLDDQDRDWIFRKRTAMGRLGYSLQLVTVRFLGLFLSDMTAIPTAVVHRVAAQLNIEVSEKHLTNYQRSEQRWRHAVEIRSSYDYGEFTEKNARFRLGRQLCALCWTGTDSPGMLFEQAVAWLFLNKILLPGVTVLERFIAEVRSRMEKRLWRLLTKNVSRKQKIQLNQLLVKPEKERHSLLEKLRKSPVRSSAPAFVKALERVEIARTVSIKELSSQVPASRVAMLARFANTAKITAISRLPLDRKIATLVAFAHHLEASAQDDALDVLDLLLSALFSGAKTKNRKVRLRTLKDLDRSTATLVEACKLLLNQTIVDNEVRDRIYAAVGKNTIINAVNDASAIIRPPDDLFYKELEQRKKTVKRFLPTLLRVLNFEGNSVGNMVIQALNWLKTKNGPPAMDIIPKSWESYVITPNWVTDYTIQLTAPPKKINKKIIYLYWSVIEGESNETLQYKVNAFQEKLTIKDLKESYDTIGHKARSDSSEKALTSDEIQCIITVLLNKGHIKKREYNIDLVAYTFCTLTQLQAAIKRRDVFINSSWRYADPRANLYKDHEWEAILPLICRSLDLTKDALPTLNKMADELDQTYRRVMHNWENNPAVRFDKNGELILTPLDELDEPESLKRLRAAIKARMPQVDLPEMVLEIAMKTKFTQAFTHINEGNARVEDLDVSLCAVLLAQACNTGLEPFIREDIPALKRDRLLWVDQHYIRDETLSAANAILVSFQNTIGLAQKWGGGDVASADGIRFIVAVRTINAAPNPKYFPNAHGLTWYNLLSNQRTGLNAITVPGTLRDSLILLAVVLEQQTELEPVYIMTDTGAYSDVVFGLFRLMGRRFSPRLADLGGARFWRIDPSADYGVLNDLSKNRIHFDWIIPSWNDILRLTGSLKLGKVPATGIMRTLQVGDKQTSLAKAIAEIGRIDKTIHMLNYIDDEARRRATLIQLNLVEGRHSLAREIFHGKRGEIHEHYREGQEDQLGALGLVLNIVSLWNTIYTDAILEDLKAEGFEVNEEDVARLSSFGYGHINMLGRYSFSMPDAVKQGKLRPFRDSKHP